WTRSTPGPRRTRGAARRGERPGIRLVCFVALAIVGRWASGPAAPAAEQKPNVLFIAIDDQNDWIGCLGGHPQVQTPHIDRLAARGTTFTNAHCQSPLCNPSRTSLLTGLRPSTTGVYALNAWFRSDERWKDAVTLPQHFMQHGYHVATTGKIFHDAYPPRRDRETGVEFTEWGLLGGPGQRPATKFVETPANHPAMDWGAYPDRDEDCFDYDVASFAVDWLAKP